MVPTAEQFDLVVIGGGPGGYAAALYAASAGLSVALVEKDKVGGTCLHRGCIPAKEFLETASTFRHVAGAKEFGIEAGQPTVDFAVSQARKQRVVDTMWKGLASVIKSRKIATYDGVGSLGPDHLVTVKGNDGNTSTLQGRHVVLAGGSVPRTIPGFDPDGSVILTSDEVLMLDHVPASVAVIGGGAIGCEFASTFADLGSRVTILEGLPKILPGCDTDVANVVVRSFTKRGLTIRTGVTVVGHERTATGTRVLVEGGDPVDVDAVIVSVGRRPFADQLGLVGTAVKVGERGFVEVDPWCRTGEAGVYAVGDVINTPQLAHVGFAEGILVVKDILGEAPMPVMYDRVPWAIYCHPEVAFAGHSEESAKAAGFDIVTSKHQYRANGRAQIVGEVEGLVKVIAEKQPDGTGGRILGVHMVGPWVTEQLGQGYLAVNWEATVAEVAEFIQPHPTLSELFGETVLSLTGRSLHG
ncbi:MAG TPA: dihydrolipoyl dehydrogenase [Acidimicrobiales bacterium]